MTHAGVVGRWLFSHEEDGARVYRPRGGKFAPSRKPRDGFDVDADGTFRLLKTGPADAPVSTTGKWTAEGDRLRVTFDDGNDRTIEIVEAGPEALKIRG